MLFLFQCAFRSFFCSLFYVFKLNIIEYNSHYGGIPPNSDEVITSTKNVTLFGNSVTVGVICKNEGGDWGDGPRSQGTPMTACRPREARRRARNQFSLTALRRNQPCQLLDLTLSAPGIVRQDISAVFVTQFVVL